MLCLHSSPIGALGSRDTGGMSVYVRELALALGAGGDRVDIYTQSATPATHTIKLAENVRLVHLGIGSRDAIPKQALYPHLNFFYDRLEAFRTSERISYDLIHSHYWLSGCLGLRAQQAWRVPHIITFHTLGAVKNMLGAQPPEPDQRIIAEQMLCRQCTAIIVGSQREARYLEQLYGTAHQQIVVIPCGVNRDRFYRIERRSARKRLGFSAPDRIVLYVGRLDPLKGAHRLIEAIGYLGTIKKLRLVIVGGDEENNGELIELQELATRLQVQDKVMFMGRVDQNELPLYYSAANVVAVPSRYESFGLVMLEAFACGTPIVAMPVGAAEAIIHKSTLGTIVRDGSAKSFAQALVRFLEHSREESAHRMTRQEAVAAYDWRRIAGIVRATYQCFIGSCSSAGRTVPYLQSKPFFYKRNLIACNHLL